MNGEVRACKVGNAVNTRVRLAVSGQRSCAGLAVIEFCPHLPARQ